MPTVPPPRKPPPAAPPPQTAASAAAADDGKIEFSRGFTARPPRIVINGVEGIGKTTIAAYADNPVILMDERETGYVTLLQSGLVPEVDYFVSGSWAKTMNVLDYLIKNQTGHKTLAIDAMAGFEKQCHQSVCDREFKSDWGEKGFLAYHKGYELSVNDWLAMLAKLDRIRLERDMTILLLSHCKIKAFRNPLGEDYDRYVADCHEKTWAPTAKWADAVLFANFLSVVKDDKGVGRTTRVVYAERRDAFDAKNRHGMRESFELPSDSALAYQTIREEMDTHAAG